MVPQEVLAFLDWWDDELLVWHLDELVEEADAESERTKNSIESIDVNRTVYLIQYS